MIMKRLYLFMIAFLGVVGSITVSAQDIPTGLIRLKSDRTSWYLSTASAGNAATTTKNLNKLDQVWILQTNGSGYSLRSANTGEYLQATMTETGSGKATLYIRKSPNATSSKELYNISAKSDCSGDFLNTNTSHNLFKYSFDAGCDWYFEAVENFTVDEIRERILGMSPYAKELEDGAYYRLVSYYDLVATGGSDISTKNSDPANFYQYWQLKKSGTGWTIQDVVSQKYIQHQTTTSAIYREGSTKVIFNIKPVNDDWDYRWTIAYGNESAGLHDASTQGHNVVLWSTNAAASEWHFEKVELSEQDIENARAGQGVYDELVKNKSQLQKKLDSLFVDKSCLTLKDDIQALSDEALAANENFAALTDDMKAMVLKVKNNTWQQYTSSTGYTAGYEKFFRAADYRIYSNYNEMYKVFTVSNPFGRLSGPTGIVANPGDILYVYVGSAPKTGTTLQLEAVSTDGWSGSHPTGELTTLKAGLNLFRFTEQKMIYILHQLTDTKKFLKDYPDITVHIEGGQLNGYWDATRGMTNDDWKLLQEKLLKAGRYINLKTERLVHQVEAEYVLLEKDNMEGLMHMWNTICANEQRYMGVEDFEGRYNNIWNVFAVANSPSYAAYSTTYGTYYAENAIKGAMKYSEWLKGGNFWVSSHEIGHNHQASINVIGTTESSNNVFSNINVFESGIHNSRAMYPHQNFEYMANGTHWLDRSIWMTTDMFLQLYLYFHVQGHNPDFYPNLFRLMRKNPINKWSGPGNGGPTSYGKDDYLHLAKMICDAAQADLSEFFEAYGMFIPCNMHHVGDYSNYDVTTTQAHINSAKAYMQKYEKKLGNIMFIDDRVIKKKADPDNIFGCVPESDGYKRQTEEWAYLMATSTSSYVGGDYESFTDDAAPVTDDWYKLSTNGMTITFQGTKIYAGHKFYDADGNLIWATNTVKATLPKCVLDLGIENVTIMTANYDMSDTPCTDVDPAVAVRDVQRGDVPESMKVFDLTGRRINTITQSGLYIVNGKKAYIK